jgi:ribose transport system substrate-binding protein
MKALRVAGWLLAGLALLGSIGCSKGSQKNKVVFVTNNPEEFWNIAEAGAKKGAEEEGVELLFLRPTPGDVATQRDKIVTALEQGIKALSVSVIDPKNQEADLNEFGDKVPLLTIDNDAPNSKRLAYLGTDNYKAGRAAGKLVKEALPDGGTVVIFVGDLAALNARQRRQGVIDELKGAAIPEDTINLPYAPNDVEIVAGKYKIFKKTFTDQPSGPAQCRTNAQDAITQTCGAANFDGKPVCLVGLWAYNPPAILGAVQDALKADPPVIKKPGDVKIVGFDEHFDTLKGIENGEIYGTIVQQPYQFGYRSVKLMAALARGDKSSLPANNKGIEYIPYRIITREAGPAKDGEPKRESATEFTTELKKLLGK